jgi:hypothetical protein
VKHRQRKYVVGIAVGLLLALAPVLSLLPTAIQMARAFIAIFRSQPPPPPDISLVPTMIGIVVCPFGLLLLLVSIILFLRSRSRAQLEQATPMI